MTKGKKKNGPCLENHPSPRGAAQHQPLSEGTPGSRARLYQAVQTDGFSGAPPTPTAVGNHLARSVSRDLPLRDTLYKRNLLLCGVW